MSRRPIMRPLTIGFAALFLAASRCPQGSPAANRLIPNDPLFSRQWHLEAVHLPEAWAITTGSEDVSIAVFDFDINLSGPDLKDSQCASRYLDLMGVKTPAATPGHGSDVISVLGACSNNGVGLTGVDWKAKILPIQAPEGFDAVALAQGIVTKEQTQVVNLSIGSSGSTNRILFDVIEGIARAGRIVVVASGNEARNTKTSPPAGFPGVITVGATKQNGSAASFSNWGKEVAVMAPGENILVREGQTRNGTSFAAPIVSGIVALMKAVNPNLNWKMARFILTNTAKPMSCGEYCGLNAACRATCCRGENNICTAGIVDAAMAVRVAQKGTLKVPLVDASPYINILKATETTADVIVRNIGGATGDFDLVSSDPHIVLTPASVTLDPYQEAKVKMTCDSASRSEKISVRTRPFDEDDPRSDWIDLLVITGST